jgi:hypothetical protein
MTDQIQPQALRQLRIEILEYSQERLAAALRERDSDLAMSQKLVSQLETGAVPIPPRVAELVVALARERHPDALDQLRTAGFVSATHSLDEKHFRQLWKDADKSVRHVELLAKLSKSAAPGFVDAMIHVKFEGLELKRGRRLYLDHIGNACGPDGRPVPFELVPAHESGRIQQARIHEDVEVKQIRHESGQRIVTRPHFVAYEIELPDPEEPTVVDLRAPQVIRLDRFDAIGFPLYSDLVAESLSIVLEVQRPLQIEPDPPTCQADLIRRTAFIPMGMVRDFEPRSHRTETAQRFVLGPIQRPRSGFFYCFTWRRFSLEQE